MCLSYEELDTQCKGVPELSAVDIRRKVFMISRGRCPNNTAHPHHDNHYNPGPEPRVPRYKLFVITWHRRLAGDFWRREGRKKNLARYSSISCGAGAGGDVVDTRVPQFCY